ncbi:MAG: MFS transporter [Pseudomonadales bacterium]
MLRTPWYHGWNILGVAMLFQAVSFGIGIYCFTFWVEPLSSEFAVGRGRVLLLFVSLQLTLGLLSPFAGQIIDRFELRWVICAGACCMAAALALTAQASSLWQIQLLFATLMVGGLLLSGPLAAQTLAARWFDRRRGLALGLSTIGTSVGGFLLPILFTSLLVSYGWRDASGWLALLVLVVVLPPVWLVIRNSPAALGIAGEGSLPLAAGATARVEYDWTTRQIFGSRAFWVIVCAFLPLAIAFGGAQQNLGPFAADQNIAPQRAAYLVSVLALTMVGAKVFFGALSDRIDHRWLFLIATLCCFAAVLQMFGQISYGRMLLIASMLGAAAGGFLPLLGAVVSARFGTLAFARVMGLVGPFTMMAALGPWLVARVRDSSGSYDGAWPIMLGVLIPAFIAILFLPTPAACEAHRASLEPR